MLCPRGSQSLTPHPHGDGLWRWGLWEEIRSGGGSPYEWGWCRYGRHPERFLIPSSTCGHSKKQKEDPHQTPNLQAL